MEKYSLRECAPEDFDRILTVVNDAATAYKGAIPGDCWHEPYMSADELKREIAGGVMFHCLLEDGEIVGVMGIQEVKDVHLIRHAYVLTGHQGKGIGGRLISRLMGIVDGGEVLVGTWAAAVWAVGFYEKHGFRLVSPAEKDRLLRKYWTVTERQIGTSVVLRLVS